MRNEYVVKLPFDLYELHLFQAVAKSRSFTRAAAAAGLTQSAITRQIQGMESSLGVTLLERTTRSVRLTSAGAFLLQESARLSGDVERILTRLREEHAGARKQIRLGVSRSIGFAYLPGFLHANLRRQPEVACQVAYQASDAIRAGLDANELDIGVFCAPPRLSGTLTAIHAFDDTFALIAPERLLETFRQQGGTAKRIKEWLRAQPRLALDPATSTGAQFEQWMAEQGIQSVAVMQLDSFDLIINLVASGMGISWVPMRALALYGQKRAVRRIALPFRFSRRVVIAVRKQRKMPPHLQRFVENILF